MIAAKALRTIFRYDPTTGTLYWLRSGPGRRANLIAGCKDRKGYFVVGFKYSGKNRLYMLHRVVWALQTGKWPRWDIDHKDRNPSNNRWNNLRQASRSQNKANSRKNRNNKSGTKGIWWCKKDRKWRSQICVNKRVYSLGSFDSSKLAAAAYKQAAEKHFGEFTFAHNCEIDVNNKM